MTLRTNIVKIYLLMLMLIALLGNNVSGQQDPMYTQYNFNQQTINPAYAGTWESMGFMALGRYQWLGMDGSPRTYTFSMQTGLENKNVGVGFNLISDKIGLEKRLGIYVDYSYRIRINYDTDLRFGLKAGLTNYQNDLSMYTQYPGDSDPYAQGEVDIRYMPNFGIGAFLSSENYYVGLSIPKIVENEFDYNYNNYSVQAELRHYFLIAGYVFNLSEWLKFKPTICTKLTLGAPVEFDFTANFLIRERFWLGAMYRTGDSFGFIAQWIIDKRLRLGYSIDFTTTELRHYNDGTHELMVSYELGLRRRWSTPRMF